MRSMNKINNSTFSSYTLLQQIYKKAPLKSSKLTLFIYFILIVIIGQFIFMYGVVTPRSSGGVGLRGLLQKQQDVGKEEGEGLLMFQACNGFANQRLSIVFGLLAGIVSKRDVILPRLPLNGEQRGGGPNIDGTSTDQSASFGSIYNLPLLRQVMQQQSVYLIESDGKPPGDVHNADCGTKTVQECLQMLGSIKGTIDIGCGFPANLVSPQVVLEYESIFIDILNGLVPAEHIQKEVERSLQTIKHRSSNANYNMLHLRLEEDWMEHCQAWGSINDGIVRDNCMNNTEAIGNVLAGVIDDVKTPLVLCYNNNVNNKVYKLALKNILNNGFHTLITNKDLIIEHHPREIKAMINYFNALKASQFIGNSVSSFSALLILERRIAGKWSAYYNGGNIPMQAFVPLYSMPWVLADDCQNLQTFKQKILPTLMQGTVVGQLDTYLYCHSQKGANKDIIELAKQNNLKIIQYNDIKQYVAQSIETLHAVWFEKQISLDSFQLPLPRFQRDYYIQNKDKAVLRLVNAQFVREVLTKKDFPKQYLWNLVENVTDEKIISEFKLDQIDSVSDTPIGYFVNAEQINKWQLMKNCKYEQFTHIGSECIRDMHVQQIV